MKITQADIKKVTDDPFLNFDSSLKTAATKKAYHNRLKKILCEFLQDILTGDPNLPKTKSHHKGGIERQFNDGDYELRVREFVSKTKNNKEWCQDVLITLVLELNKKTKLVKSDPDYIKPGTVNDYLKPIQKLLDSNGISISWPYIKSKLEKDEIIDDTFGYELTDIQLALKHCKAIDRVIILLWVSSGIRAGGFNLRWEHIKPVYLFKNKYLFEDQDVTESVVKEGKIVCAMLRVYPNSSEEYIAFVTPECYDAILEYRKTWILETGHEPKPTDPFLKQAGPFVKPLGLAGISKRVDKVLREAGIRRPLVKGAKRHKIPLFNGFRRFYNKQSKKSLTKNSPLASLILKETLLGHEGLIKLDKNYFKEHIYELLEEYLSSIADLTISDEDRTKAELEETKVKVNDIDELKKAVKELKAEAKIGKVIDSYIMQLRKEGKIDNSDIDPFTMRLSDKLLKLLRENKEITELTNKQFKEN